jgi:hypothetical protein
MYSHLIRFISFSFIVLALTSSSSIADPVAPLKDITEEEGVAYGDYIIPNELDNWMVKRPLQHRTGTFISVGTFRTLFSMTWGDFSRVVMLDHDRLSSEFNRANLKWIIDFGTSGLAPDHQRYQYLASLHKCNLTASDLKWLENMPGPEVFRIQALLNALTFFLETSDTRCNLTFPYVSEKIQQILGSLALNESFHRINRIELNRETALAYWSSDGLWRFVQKMAYENRISVINGSLIGDVTLASLGAELDRQDERVSAIDLSNAIDYIEDPRILITNLKRLPLRMDANVLFTGDDFTRDERFFGYDYWDYFNLSFTSFSVNYSSYRNLIRYLREIYGFY